MSMIFTGAPLADGLPEEDELPEPPQPAVTASVATPATAARTRPCIGLNRMTIASIQGLDPYVIHVTNFDGRST
jgi:hypothetical protein